MSSQETRFNASSRAVRSAAGLAAAVAVCAGLAAGARAEEEQAEPSEAWATPHYDKGFVLVSSLPSAGALRLSP